MVLTNTELRNLYHANKISGAHLHGFKTFQKEQKQKPSLIQ